MLPAGGGGGENGNCRHPNHWGPGGQGGLQPQGCLGCRTSDSE